jgi:hypothetical protein
MADQFDSPVDVTAEVTGVSGLAQLATCVGVAVIVLALFNAHALAAWADGLTPSTRSAAAVAVSHELADATAQRGLDSPRAALKSGWDQAKAARWAGQRADEDQR